MGINTTINIKPFLKAKIFDAALLCNVTMNDIIELLILKIMHNSDIEPCMFESVKYQEKNKTLEWKKLHVSYDKNMYEVVLDLRKIFKKSVSRIVAEGINVYLDEIVKELCSNEKSKNKNADNYLPKYTFKSTTYKKIYHFAIYWKFPPPKMLKSI